MSTFQTRLPGSDHLTVVPATLPTTAAGQTSDLTAIDVGVHVGRLVKMDIAMDPGQDAQATIWLFSEAAGEAVNTVVQLDEVSGDYHPVLNHLFANADDPQTTRLYAQVAQTHGNDETLAIPIRLWIES
jgi:hypothetical protein